MPLEEDGNRNILSSLRDLHCARSIASISRYDLLSKTCECQQGPQGTDLYSRLVRYPIQPFEHGCEYYELVTSDYRSLGLVSTSATRSRVWSPLIGDTHNARILSKTSYTHDDGLLPLSNLGSATEFGALINEDYALPELTNSLE
jgi:hypothetical protein